MKAVQKVNRKSEEKTTTVIQKQETNKSVFVKSDKKIIKINLEDINYIEAYGNYVKIYTDKMILTPQTLSDFLEKLSNDFIRIHKSFIINFTHLKMIEGNQIILQDSTKLPIGKSYKKELLDCVNNI